MPYNISHVFQCWFTLTSSLNWLASWCSLSHQNELSRTVDDQGQKQSPPTCVITWRPPIGPRQIPTSLNFFSPGFALIPWYALLDPARGGDPDTSTAALRTHGRHGQNPTSIGDVCPAATCAHPAGRWCLDSGLNPGFCEPDTLVNYAEDRWLALVTTT
jgi:hypothetical protein